MSGNWGLGTGDWGLADFGRPGDWGCRWTVPGFFHMGTERGHSLYGHKDRFYCLFTLTVYPYKVRMLLCIHIGLCVHTSEFDSVYICIYSSVCPYRLLHMGKEKGYKILLCAHTKTN